MKTQFTFLCLTLISSIFALFACDTAPNQTEMKDYTSSYDTVATVEQKKRDPIKHQSKPVDVKRKFDVQVLGDMLTWEWFDAQKYLMAQDFDLVSGGKKVEYLWREADFGLPEQTMDSLVFQRTDETGAIQVKILTEDNYNYTDEQRKDMYHYKGNPKEYSDPFNARSVKPAYSYHYVILYSDNRTSILHFIEQFESLGCKFEKDVLGELAQEQIERSVPTYRRAREIRNSCSCPDSLSATFNNASISFTTSFEPATPAYRLVLHTTSY